MNNYDPGLGAYLGLQADSRGNQSFDNGEDGNYWSDYQVRYPGAQLINGHWDNPYEINQSEGTKDRFPLYSRVDLIPPKANAGDDITICAGEKVELKGSGDGELLWSTGQSGASIDVEPNRTTVYTLSLTLSNGETISDDITVFVENCDNSESIAEIENSI